MSLLSELIARLRAAITHTGEAAAGVHRARDQLEQAATAARAVTDGSSNPLPAEGDAQLRAAIAKADEATALIAAGSDTMERYITGPLLGGGSGGGGAPPGAPPTPVPASGPPRRDPNTIGPDEGMAGIRPYSQAGTAEGNLFFTTGKQNDRPLKATPGATKFEPGEIRPEWQHTKPAQGHIEGNVAADMLHTGQTRAVLFLNAEPCDHSGNGCKTNTAHYLKPGSELTIKVCGENGKLRLRKKITGTGEALTGE